MPSLIECGMWQTRVVQCTSCFFSYILQKLCLVLLCMLRDGRVFAHNVNPVQHTNIVYNPLNPVYIFGWGNVKSNCQIPIIFLDQHFYPSLTSSYSYSRKNMSLRLLHWALIMRRVVTEPGQKKKQPLHSIG